jgi:uncharacterized caspase-like protein
MASVSLWLARSLLLGAVAIGGGAFAEERVALVIGNARYQGIPLRNPINDANAVADRLRALGFAVDLKTDVSQREMTRAISRFGTRLKTGSVALFYFAGHGLQVKGRNFLVPVDAEIMTEASVRSEAVDLDLLLEQLGPARLSMVILDACRNNPFEGRFRSLRGSGLAQVDAPKGTLIAYATAPGKVAADGETNHGVYTSALLEALDISGLKVEEIFKRVRVNVARSTGNLQIPWEASSLTGDFYFKAHSSEGDQRGDLHKVIEEERARRERESAALRSELDALRAQISMIRPRAPASDISPGTSDVPSSSSTTTTLQRPESKSSPVTGVPPATAAGSPGKSANEKLAITSALLDARSSLTFSKGMALMLSAGAGEELDQLLESERALKSFPYHTAFAMGVNSNGHLVWAAQWRQALRAHAEQEAIGRCNGYLRGEGTCTLISVDGEMIPGALAHISRQLGRADVSLVRRSFLSRRPKAQ